MTGLLICLQTFDGERCLYAALNDEVRHLLLDEGFKRAGGQLPHHVNNTSNMKIPCRCHIMLALLVGLSLDPLCCDATGARGHDLFLDFVGKVFNVPEAYPDLSVDFGDEIVHAHKFLLAVRAPAIGGGFPRLLLCSCAIAGL